MSLCGAYSDGIVWCGGGMSVCVYVCVRVCAVQKVHKVAIVSIQARVAAQISSEVVLRIFLFPFPALLSSSCYYYCYYSFSSPPPALNLLPCSLAPMQYNLPCLCSVGSASRHVLSNARRAWCDCDVIHVTL